MPQLKIPHTATKTQYSKISKLHKYLKINTQINSTTSPASFPLCLLQRISIELSAFNVSTSSCYSIFSEYSSKVLVTLFPENVFVCEFHIVTINRFFIILIYSVSKEHSIFPLLKYFLLLNVDTPWYPGLTSCSIGYFFLVFANLLFLILISITEALILDLWLLLYLHSHFKWSYLIPWF